MIPLILFVLLGLTILVLFEVDARKKSAQSLPADESKPIVDDSGCCGQHLVCERETLLQSNAEIIYYDDEELDQFAGIEPDSLPEDAAEQIRAVFRTLQEKDVPGWVRSLQLRNIQLPYDVREEALLIVRERRKM
mgnify:CR=1 FL=1